MIGTAIQMFKEIYILKMMVLHVTVLLMNQVLQLVLWSVLKLQVKKYFMYLQLVLEQNVLKQTLAY